MIRNESPIECALVVQAVAVAEFGPWAPQRMETGPTQVNDGGWNEERREAPGAVLEQRSRCSRSIHFEPADPAADVHPHGVFGVPA